MSKLQRAEFTQKHFLISEKIADSIWEIWRASKTASHPVRAGEVTPEQVLDSSIAV